MSKNQTAILFRCHSYSSFIQDSFRKLSHEARAYADIYLCFDRTSARTPEFESENLFVFAEEDLHNLGYGNYSQLDDVELMQALVWYHADYPVLLFYKKYPNYQNIWALDYDVHFTGNWAKFFEYFDKSTSSFIASKILAFEDCPDWNNWKKPNQIGIETKDCFKAFFPVTRFSKQALETLDKDYRQGKFGYCEVCVPTLLNAAGLSMHDLSEEGVFADSESLRYRPIRSKPGEKINFLYHPVREIEK
jgi:hypothetical protein